LTVTLPLSVWIAGPEELPNATPRRWPGIRPSVARLAVDAYSSPGDLVIDPLSGHGGVVPCTAGALGRRAAGIAPARSRPTRCRERHDSPGPRPARKAEQAPVLAAADDATLLLTGPSLPAQVHSESAAIEVAARITRSIATALPVVTLGGFVVVVTRPIRVRSRGLFDTPGRLANSLASRELVQFDRNVALSFQLVGEAIEAAGAPPCHDDVLVLRRMG
jgi:hypothetical protein